MDHRHPPMADVLHSDANPIFQLNRNFEWWRRFDVRPIPPAENRKKETKQSSQVCLLISQLRQDRPETAPTAPNLNALVKERRLSGICQWSTNDGHGVVNSRRRLLRDHLCFLSTLAETTTYGGGGL